MYSKKYWTVEQFSIFDKLSKEDKVEFINTHGEPVDRCRYFDTTQDAINHRIYFEAEQNGLTSTVISKVASLLQLETSIADWTPCHLANGDQGRLVMSNDLQGSFKSKVTELYILFKPDNAEYAYELTSHYESGFISAHSVVRYITDDLAKIAKQGIIRKGPKPDNTLADIQEQLATLQSQYLKLTEDMLALTQLYTDMVSMQPTTPQIQPPEVNLPDLTPTIEGDPTKADSDALQALKEGFTQKRVKEAVTPGYTVKDAVVPAWRNVNLKDLRTQRGKTQAEMASMLGITRSTYQHYERDSRLPYDMYHKYRSSI